MAHIRVRLADPLAKLPLPGAPGVYAPEGVFTVDPSTPYWSQAIADGSVVRAADDTMAAPVDAGEAKPTTKR